MWKTFTCREAYRSSRARGSAGLETRSSVPLCPPFSLVVKSVLEITCFYLMFLVSASILTRLTNRCRLVYQAVLERKNPQVIKDFLRIVGEPSDSKWLSSSPQDIASRLFHTAYLGMAENSSKDTRSRAKALAKDIGA